MQEVGVCAAGVPLPLHSQRALCLNGHPCRDWLKSCVAANAFMRQLGRNKVHCQTVQCKLMLCCTHNCVYAATSQCEKCYKSHTNELTVTTMCRDVYKITISSSMSAKTSSIDCTSAARSTLCLGALPIVRACQQGEKWLTQSSLPTAVTQPQIHSVQHRVTAQMWRF